MPHRERLKELIKLQGFRSQAKFCQEIGYAPINLSNYLTGGKAYPNGELIFKIGQSLPNWNINYWITGEGIPIYDKSHKEYIEVENKEQKISLKELREHIDHLEKQIKNNRDRIELISDRMDKSAK